MINHYSHDRKFIYELDIRHLDESRAAAVTARTTVARCLDPIRHERGRMKIMGENDHG